MKEGRLGASLALASLLGALLAFPGPVEAAPQVLPVADSLVDVDGSVDTLRWQGSAAVAVGSTFTLTGPDGSTMSFTRTGAASDSTQVWFLNGSQSSTGTEWTSTGSLDGVPADGTWTISLDGPLYPTANSPTVGVTLAVGGEQILFGVSGSSPQTTNQFWNWRIGTLTELNSLNCAVPCNDPQADYPGEDPNNAVFFQDAAESPFTAHTLHFNVTCAAVPTMTINGAWLGGVGTIFSQHFTRDGNFVGTADLRSIFGTTITTEENEGSLTNGTDTETVAYNNAAGTSYQFKVRNSTDEALGFVAFAPPGQCTPAAPGGSVLYVRSIGLSLSASQAQCAFDEISFSTTVDVTALLTLADLQVTIFDASNGTELVTFDDAQMFTQNAGQVYYFATVLAPGSYMAIAQADIVGIGAVDFYDAAAVNVPRGPCTDTPTDLSPVLLAIDSSTTILQGNISNVNQTVLSILTAIANHDLNTTFQYLLLNQSLLNLTTLIEGLNLTVDCSGGCNFTLNETLLSQIFNNLTDHRNGTLELMNMDFDGLTFPELTLYFVWLFVLIWSLRNAKLMCAVAATIGVALVIIVGQEWTQIVAVLLFAVALWLEATARERIYARWFKGKKLGEGN